jgi:hypothetical protein
MTPRNFGLNQQGKRDDQVTFSELVGGICLGLVIVALIGSCFLARATP